VFFKIAWLVAASSPPTPSTIAAHVKVVFFSSPDRHNRHGYEITNGATSCGFIWRGETKNQRPLEGKKICCSPAANQAVCSPSQKGEYAPPAGPPDNVLVVLFTCGWDLSSFLWGAANSLVCSRAATNFFPSMHACSDRAPLQAKLKS
jgi:hypothetical protein